MGVRDRPGPGVEAGPLGAAAFVEEMRALADVGVDEVHVMPLQDDLVRQMWSVDDGPFDGKHYQLAETINSPQPLRKPRPPIMVGGGGEREGRPYDEIRRTVLYTDPVGQDPTRSPSSGRSASASYPGSPA